MRRTGQGHRDARRSPDAQHGNADGHPGEPGLAALRTASAGLSGCGFLIITGSPIGWLRC